MQTHCGFPLLIMRGVVVSRVATVPFKILLDAGFLLSRVDYTMERSTISGKSPQQPRVFEVFRNTEVAGLFQYLFGNPKHTMQPQQPRVFEVSKHRGCWAVSMFV